MWGVQQPTPWPQRASKPRSKPSKKPKTPKSLKNPWLHVPERTMYLTHRRTSRRTQWRYPQLWEVNRGTRDKNPLACQKTPTPAQAEPWATGPYWPETHPDPQKRTHHIPGEPESPHHMFPPTTNGPKPTTMTQPTATISNYIPCNGDSKRPQCLCETHIEHPLSCVVNSMKKLILYEF